MTRIILVIAALLVTTPAMAQQNCIVTKQGVWCSDGSTGMRTDRGIWWNDGSSTTWERRERDRQPPYDVRRPRERERR